MLFQNAAAKPFSMYAVAWFIAGCTLLLDWLAPQWHPDWATMFVCLTCLEGPHVYASFAARYALYRNGGGGARVAGAPTRRTIVFCVAEVLFAFVVWMFNTELFFGLLTIRAVHHNIAQAGVVCARVWGLEALSLPLASLVRSTVAVGMWAPVLLWWCDEHRGMDWYHWETDLPVALPPFIVPIVYIACLIGAVAVAGTFVAVWYGTDPQRTHAMRSVALAVVTLLTWAAGLHVNDRASAFALLTIPHAFPSLGNSFAALSAVLTTKRRQTACCAALVLAGCFEYWLVEFFVGGPSEYDAFFVYALPQLLHMQVEPLLFVATREQDEGSALPTTSSPSD